MNFTDDTSKVLTFLCSGLEGSDASSISDWSVVLFNLILQIEIGNILFFFRSSNNLCVIVLILEAQHQYFCIFLYLFSFTYFSIQGSFRVDALFATTSFRIFLNLGPCVVYQKCYNKSNFLSVLFYRMLAEQHFTETYAVKCYVLVKSYYLKVPLQSKCFFFLFLRLNVWAQ